MALARVAIVVLRLGLAVRRRLIGTAPRIPAIGGCPIPPILWDDWVCAMPSLLGRRFVLPVHLGKSIHLFYDLCSAFLSRLL